MVDSDLASRHSEFRHFKSIFGSASAASKFKRRTRKPRNGNDPAAKRTKGEQRTAATNVERYQ